MESKKQPKAAPVVDSVDPRELEIVKEIDEKLKFLLSSRANAGDLEEMQRELSVLRLKISEEQARNKTLEDKYKLLIGKMIQEGRKQELMLLEQTRSNAKLLEEQAEDKKTIENLLLDLEEIRKKLHTENIPYRKQIYELVKKACVDGDRCKEAESKLGVANQHFWELEEKAEKEVKMLREKMAEMEKALHKAKTDLGRARAEKNAAKKTIEEMKEKAKTTGRQGYSPRRDRRDNSYSPFGRDNTPDWLSTRRRASPYHSDDSDDEPYPARYREWASAGTPNPWQGGYRNRSPRKTSPVAPRGAYANGFRNTRTPYRRFGSPDPIDNCGPRAGGPYDFFSERSRPTYRRGTSSPIPARWYSPDSASPKKPSEDLNVKALLANAPRGGDGSRVGIDTFRSRRREFFKAANSKITPLPPHSAMSPTVPKKSEDAKPKKQFGRQVDSKASPAKPKAGQAKPKKFRNGGFPQGGFPSGGFQPMTGFPGVGGAPIPKMGGASGAFPHYESDEEKKVMGFGFKQDVFKPVDVVQELSEDDDDDW